MKIYSGLVGKFAIDIPNTITGQVLPVNLISDLSLDPEWPIARFTREEVPSRITHPSKLAYIGGVNPEKFTGMIALQDAGCLTSCLATDLRFCKPYMADVDHNDATLADYCDNVREVTTELSVAIRLVFPNARLVACEAYDLTSLNATSDVDPHPLIRRRHSWLLDQRLWEHWEIGTSLYRNDEDDATFARWAKKASQFADVAFVTPKANGKDESPERLARTLSILNDRWDNFGDCVIWGNPTSVEDAQQHAAIASLARRTMASPTTEANG